MRYLLSLLLLLALPASVRAQFAVYGLVGASHLSGQTSPVAPSNSNWLYGPALGIYYTPLHLGPVAAGLDLRGNYSTGGNQHLRGVLAGLRVSAKAPILPLRPYAQASVGVAGIRYDPTGNLPTHYSNKFEYALHGGLDITVLPRIDLRVLELGYGHITGVSSTTPATATNLFNVGAGIVFRLP